jgi:hypothetical protein
MAPDPTRPALGDRVAVMAELTCPACGAEVPRPASSWSHTVSGAEQERREAAKRPGWGETAECLGCGAPLTRALDPPDAPWHARE